MYSARFHGGYYGSCVDVNAQSSELSFSAAGEVFGIRRQHARCAFQQDDLRIRRIDTAEVPPEGTTRNFCQSAG
jgi:hypothetical protein